MAAHCSAAAATQRHQGSIEGGTAHLEPACTRYWLRLLGARLLLLLPVVPMLLTLALGVSSQPRCYCSTVTGAARTELLAVPRRAALGSCARARQRGGLLSEERGACCCCRRRGPAAAADMPGRAHGVPTDRCRCHAAPSLKGGRRARLPRAFQRRPGRATYSQHCYAARGEDRSGLAIARAHTTNACRSPFVFLSCRASPLRGPSLLLHTVKLRAAKGGGPAGVSIDREQCKKPPYKAAGARARPDRFTSPRACLPALRAMGLPLGRSPDLGPHAIRPSRGPRSAGKPQAQDHLLHPCRTSVGPCM